MQPKKVEILPATTEHIDAQVQEHGWQLQRNPAAIERLFGENNDPNHQALMQSHASRCPVCADADGLLAETEEAYMLGGYSEQQAAQVMDVAEWEWRKHVIAKGLHVTRNSYRDTIRAELLYETNPLTLSMSDRLALMRDLDKAEGVGNPTFIKQVAEYRQNIVNINGATQGGAQRTPDFAAFDEMSDEDLKAIMRIAGEYHDDDLA